MRRRRIAGGLLAIGALAWPTAAGALVYFHKPGVEPAAFVTDSIACESLAQGVDPPRQPVPYNANPYAAGTGAFLAGMMQSRERRAMIESVLRTCMADRGYRRVKASAAARKSLDKLDDDARIARLAALGAAAAPEGEVLPR